MYVNMCVYRAYDNSSKVSGQCVRIIIRIGTEIGDFDQTLDNLAGFCQTVIIIKRLFCR